MGRKSKKKLQKDKQPVIHIQQRRRKSLAMRVNAAGEVVVSIPTWIKPNDPQVKRFIKAGLKKLDAYVPADKPEIQHNPASVRRLLDEWAARMNVQPKRVQFRQMTRKWGSCSSKGSVTLNESLFYLPHHLVEYVVVHELAHLVELNHSPAFWALLGEYLPDYAEREAELNGYHV